MFFEKKQLTSFESILIRESGMRFRVEYEIEPKDDKAQISLYRIMIRDREDVRELDSQAVMSRDEFIALCNRCGLMGWNGFHGAHPKGVHDGIMFTLEARVNGGEKIKAEGSENFPKHYREFVSELSSALRGS